MQNIIGGATVYMTSLQQGYILQADELKFDFKPTNKKNNVATNCFYDRF